MIKLITPPAMLLTVALLVIYSVYAFLIGWIEKSWMLLVGGGVAIVATYGVGMLRPWSRYLVYLLTLGFLGKLGMSIFEGLSSGFFAFQFGSMAQGALALLPAFLMALLSAACCALVYRQFLPTSDRAEPGLGPRGRPSAENQEIDTSPPDARTGGAP